MLTLLQIKATNKVDQVNLVLSDDSIIPFPVDQLSPFGLSKGMEIDNQLLSRLLFSSVSFAAYNYALRLLGMTPQTKLTIFNKLNIYLKKLTYKRKIDLSRTDHQQIIEDIVNRLESRQLLNDIEYAKFLLRKHSRKSRQEQLYRLKLAGIDIQSLPDDLLADTDESTVITNLIHKKIANLDNLSDPNTKNKLMAFLVRKGFPFSSIKTVIDEMMSNR